MRTTVDTYNAMVRALISSCTAFSPLVVCYPRFSFSTEAASAKERGDGRRRRRQLGTLVLLCSAEMSTYFAGSRFAARFDGKDSEFCLSQLRAAPKNIQSDMVQRGERGLKA